jgi:hypothetical protein
VEYGERDNVACAVVVALVGIRIGDVVPTLLRLLAADVIDDGLDDAEADTGDVCASLTRLRKGLNSHAGANLDVIEFLDELVPRARFEVDFNDAVVEDVDR